MTSHSNQGLYISEKQCEKLIEVLQNSMSVTMHLGDKMNKVEGKEKTVAKLKNLIMDQEANIKMLKHNKDI